VPAVCADPAREKYAGFWIQDCSAATQNILLAAHALGLGAVWLGIAPGGERARQVADLLQLPQGVEPLALIAVGHPAETVEPLDRYDPQKTHHNQW
jgi:nitroreductase